MSPPRCSARRRPRLLPLVLLLTATPALASPTASSPTASSPTASMESCAGCHPAATAAYRRHGMSRSLGRIEAPPSGEITNPRTGWRYEVRAGEDGPVLTSVAPDGGVREQRLVGRLGAGIFDRSWAAVELDPLTGEPTDRLFFAPVETITGHGLELSPFEHSERPSGPNMPLGQGCLECHTRTRVKTLPGAALPASAGPAEAHPGNALGVAAFEHLEPLGCEACHGDVGRHVQLAEARPDPEAPWRGELGLVRLGQLEAGRQRDVCARCHLQGDARFKLSGGGRSGDRPLAAHLVAMVADREPDRAGEDFRFVAQLERLALSSCFRATPEMTCVTCHGAHTSVAEQGIAGFERTCQQCHGGEDACSRPPGLEVATVTGAPARGEAGCVDCHVRRSQPFDLPGIASVDHFVRRRPPPPREVPFRSVTDPGAPLRPFDDGRLAEVLETPGGRKWSRGLAAMAYVQVGRFEEALEAFSAFPPAGTAAARKPSAPAPLVPLETQVSFHEQRALAHLAANQVDKARLAYDDALVLEPGAPGALVGRARLAVGAEDFKTALLDTEKLIQLWPGSEAPWDVRTRLAERIGRPDLALDALREQVKRWPSNADAWMRLGLLEHQAGDAAAAGRAFEYVRRLQPLMLERQAPPSLERR